MRKTTLININVKGLKKTLGRGVLSLSFILGCGTGVLAQEMEQTATSASHISETWQQNAADVCVKYGDVTDKMTQSVQYITQTLSQSQHGALLLAYADKHGASICFDLKDIGRSGYFDQPANALVLTDDIVTLKTVKTAAHELRHKWQMDQGFGASTEYTPEHRALVGKIMEADAEAYANLVVYELEQKGYDIAAAFGEHYDYRGVYDGFQNTVSEERGNKTPYASMRAAFDAWFDLPVAQHYEHTYFKGFLNFVDNPAVVNHYPVSYGNKTMSHEKILSLGDMLDGQNYLQESGGITAMDPKYTTPLNDENAALLQQLKQKIVDKQKSFCAERPAQEQRFCAPYPTRVKL